MFAQMTKLNHLEVIYKVMEGVKQQICSLKYLLLGGYSNG